MKGGIRIRLPLEAVIVLETLYREGMTTNKRTDLVQKAVETTGLDRVKVKNWIQNRRGKARRRDPNYATQKPAPTPNFTMSTAPMKPLSLGSSPTRLYKRHRSASTGSLNLHHPHPQFITPFKLKNVDMQQDRKHLAEKSWAEVSQALAALSYHGYHFVCSVYSPEDNFTAVRSSGYGATFLSTIQGDKGVENLWKAAEVLEESKKRTANLIANVRPTGRSLPEGTNSSKRSMSESESENDREDYDSEEDEDDSDEADEESKEMNASTLSSGYDHRRANPNPHRVSAHSAPAESGSVLKVVGSVIKRPSSASSTSAALTLAALADAVFATSSADRRDVNPKEPGAALAPIVRPKNTTENAGAGTKLDRFGNNDSNLTKLPSPSDIVSISFPTGQLASQPPGQSPGYRTHVSPTAKPHPSPAWNIAGSVLLNKQGAKPSFSHPLQNRDISLPGQPGYPYASGTERNQMMENNILPLPNIQYNTTAVNDASAKHG